ncbi:ribosomal protein S18 acetylase RimI-like enzyme [Allocatelliglobosispora scoriae]|uniref:Ribosomal protein S18 acetylase RimI-like enzyme n=1 Tax=Allocatelliglobosispora scoriae TaxID=643052 RepID=A0A841C6G3_9ACTN|nr:GNAT family N-acetyltransferase [Allocatelliglobosispora scoriae]MBB5874520.1 ribosomal protein S18 acetylase RimI-like enzyme [Allocatelliglobosispora scoriae]
MALPSPLAGRSAVLQAARNHPFARLRAHGQNLIGYAGERSVVWTAENGGVSSVCAVGDPDEILAICAGADLIRGAAVLELPHVDIDILAPLFRIEKHDHWSVLWTREPSPHHDADDRVVLLPESEYAAIDSLLDIAFPATRNRPGQGPIRRWFGIHEDGQLVAVGADRSRNGVGYLVAIAVLPSRQSRGHGAALTRRMTRELLGEFDICALGVTAANTRARLLYHRLGFTEGIDLTSVRLR